MKKNKGETIVEILIAMTILVLIITSTYVILLRAMKTNTSIKNRVRALNIAREGIEGVRNIRDTNWLRYSGNRRDKWLCRPGISNSPVSKDSGSGYTLPAPISGNSASIENNKYYNKPIVDSIQGFGLQYYLHNCIENLQSGYYTLEYFEKPYLSSNISPRYILEPQLAKDPIPATDQTNRDNQKERFRLHWDTLTNRVTHASSFYNPTGPGSTIENEESIFYRVIELEVANVYEDPTAPGASSCLSNSIDPGCSNLKKLKVRSQVTWDENGDNDFETINLETQLYDYFERTDY